MRSRHLVVAPQFGAGLLETAPCTDAEFPFARAEARVGFLRARVADLEPRLQDLERRFPRARRRSAVMVDLETMGTTPGSAIVSIGAVVFDPVAGVVGPKGLYVVVDLGSNALFGLRQDPATRAWWAKQSPEARAVLEDPTAVPLYVALDRFDAFWRDVGGVEFWAHGPNFDETLLGAAYRAARRRPPWQFWNTRCTRTIYAAAGVSPDRRKGVHHNALDDAFNQVDAVLLVPTARGDRFFCGFGRKGQLQTAWSLAGATQFQARDLERIEAVETRLIAKGYFATRAEIDLSLAAERDQLQAEVSRLSALINAPELRSFSEGVVLEAVHQVERYGADHDAGKQPSDWFWLVGFLAGKALNAALRGDLDKALHHCVSTAAAMANWHRALSGADSRMQPGIAPPAGEGQS